MTKIQFRKGSYASTIIEYVALGVEFPWKSLYLIPGDHRIILRTIRNLKDNGYIIISGKGKTKTIKLAKKSLSILDKIYNGLFDYYMYNSENHTSRGAKANDKATASQMIARKHRIAETLCMMKMIDTNILFSEKPLLKVKYTDANDISDLNEPIFYNSREIKNIDPKQKHKTEFSRIAGFLISKGGYYNIYNINNGLIKWNQYGESKAKVLTDAIINSSFPTYLKTHTDSNSTAIMFAHDFGAAEKLLSSRGSRPDKNGFELISFDNTYTNIHIIPLDMYGALQLKIITTENWHDRLMECIFGKIEKLNTTAVDCDLFIGNKYILTMFDGNIARLKRFNQSIYMYGSEHFEILCFPWQSETIINILDFNIKITEIPIEDVINAFFS